MEASPFETSEILASFLASTPLLSESWRMCTVAATSPRRFVAEEQSGVGIKYVAFPSVHQMAGGSECNWTKMVALDSIGGVPLFSSHRVKEGTDEEAVMVNAGMLNLFSSLFNPFQNQILAIMGNSKTKSIVITGHSIGGAIASLCALWLLSYLQHLSSSVSVLCITFGSPLLGNGSLSRAILKERWAGNFCHVVSKHDIVPRLLFSPITLYTAQLNYLLQFWQFSMISPRFGKLAVQISEKQKVELFNFVLSHLYAAASQDGEGSAPILFHPFGSYFFVSEEGAVCVDSSIAVIKMLHLMLVSSSATSSIEDHLKYGDYVNRLSLQSFSNKNSMQGKIPDTSYEAGLELAIKFSGLLNQELAIEPAKECLEMTRRMGPSPTQNAARLAIRLSKFVPYRAEIEWYKAWCDQQIDQMGYYDLFKRRRGYSKRDIKVNMNRYKLARFWNDVIAMLERNELPNDFVMRAKWINASHFYKLLVEPLDIAEYYGKRKHTTKGHYIQHGREKRYEIFDRWWKDSMVTAENNVRSTFASLTQDSCFWAKVEEASDWLDSFRSEKDTSRLAVLWNGIEKFEKYAMELIEKKEVSLDVLAKNSSYSKWVGDLRELRTKQR